MVAEMKQVYKKVVCEAEQDLSSEAQKEGDSPQGLRKDLWRYRLSLTLKNGFANVKLVGLKGHSKWNYYLHFTIEKIEVQGG